MEKLVLLDVFNSVLVSNPGPRSCDLCLVRYGSSAFLWQEKGFKGLRCPACGGWLITREDHKRRLSADRHKEACWLAAKHFHGGRLRPAHKDFCYIRNHWSAHVEVVG